MENFPTSITNNLDFTVFHVWSSNFFISLAQPPCLTLFSPYNIFSSSLLPSSVSPLPIVFSPLHQVSFLKKEACKLDEWEVLLVTFVLP